MLQSYKHPFAVYEYFGNYFQTFFSMVTNDDDNVVILVILVICQNRKRKVKIRHYNNKNDIFIIIVSKMTTSEIENDQNDLDQNDHLTSTVVCNVEM